MKSCSLLLALVFAAGVIGWSSVPVFAAEKPAASATVELIHLNQATAEQLQALPGVGPALSERIVLHRAEHGPFTSLEQLAVVKGIGQAKLAKFRDRLTLD